MSEDRTEEQIDAEVEWRRRAADPNDPYGKNRKPRVQGGGEQPCPECVRPGDDPQLWCECLPDEQGAALCRNRAHAPVDCRSRETGGES